MKQSLKIAITVLVVLLARFALSITTTQSILLGTVTSLLLWYFYSGESKQIPPGPPTLPLIGNASVFFQKDIFKYTNEMHKKYGPIVCFNLGGDYSVSISDYDMIKELSVHPELQLRPVQGVFHDMNKGLGLIFSEGNLWKQQRRFVLHSLRDSGMGKFRMQEKIHNELDNVFKVIDGSKGNPMYIKELLEKSTANVIFALAFGKQYDYDDEKFVARISALDGNIRLGLKVVMYEFIPLAGFFVNGLRKQMMDNLELMKDQSREFISEHRATLDPNNPRDLLDLFLMEMDKDVEEGKDDNGYHESFFEEQLTILITDLFLAGAETSSTTITWALLYMIHHPDVQQKVQKEIIDVVGTERYPQIEDRLNLPYTTATLQEVERLASVVPSGITRCNGSTFKYRNYVFPKRTEFEFALYTVHRDPKLWKEPLKFDPTRFIDSDGKVFRPPYLMPFGSGKRSCVGEALAKMEIFLYFATLLQNFVFEAPDKDCLPTTEPTSGAVRAPFKYQLKCTRREH